MRVFQDAKWSSNMKFRYARAVNVNSLPGVDRIIFTFDSTRSTTPSRPPTAQHPTAQNNAPSMVIQHSQNLTEDHLDQAHETAKISELGQ
jgi:hypothetical protein